MPSENPSRVEPGVYVHADGGAKIHIAKARGVTLVAPGVVALTPALIARLARAGRTRRSARTRA